MFLKSSFRKFTKVASVIFLLVGINSLVPAQAASKYALTCKVGGQTTLAKPPIGYPQIEFSWYQADGSLISRELVISPNTSALTPANAKSVVAKIFNQSLGYNSANSNCR